MVNPGLEEGDLGQHVNARRNLFVDGLKANRVLLKGPSVWLVSGSALSLSRVTGLVIRHFPIALGNF